MLTFSDHEKKISDANLTGQTLAQEDIIGLRNTAEILKKMESSYPNVVPVPRSTVPVLSLLRPENRPTPLRTAAVSEAKPAKVTRFERPLGFDVASLTRASEIDENLDTTEYDLAAEEENEINEEGEVAENIDDDFSE